MKGSGSSPRVGFAAGAGASSHGARRQDARASAHRAPGVSHFIEGAASTCAKTNHAGRSERRPLRRLRVGCREPAAEDNDAFNDVFVRDLRGILSALSADGRGARPNRGR